MSTFKNKLSLVWTFYMLSIAYFSEYSFAAVWSNELEKSQNNTSIILAFFSTDMLLNVIFAWFTVILTIILSKIAASKISSYVESSYKWKESGREELIWVISRTINIIILTIWSAITLTILWIDMWIFMWGLWFGVGFTLKVFLSNFISWILMVTQWFYHLWDVIKIGERVWTIRKIHALFTEVEQFDWIVYFIPNVKFLEEDVSNFHTNDKRRVDVNIWVDYDTDVVKAKKVMLQVVAQFPNVLQTPSSDVIVSKINDSSIDLSLRFWMNSKDSYFVSKSNVTETVNMAFKKAWIVIAFPQVTLSSRDNFSLQMDK